MKCLLWAALSAACVGPEMAAAATVAPLEGPAITVSTLTFADGQARAGERTFALADLDWIELLAPPAAPPTAVESRPRLGLWFTDGSWLPATALAAGTGDQILATTPFGEHPVALSLISGWGTALLAPAADGLDRVLVASGTLDGRVRGVRDGKLLFASSLDPEPLAIELGEVVGLRLAQPAVAPTGMSLLVDADPGYAPVRLRVQGMQLVLAASGRAVHGVDTARLRIDGGRRVWLSGLTPATVHEQGAFGVVWPWQRDLGLDGAPLVLGGVRYAKGIAVHSAAQLAWDLGGSYVRLRAMLGIADAVAPEGDCIARISGDGRELWRRDRVRGTDRPTALDLEVRGVQRLELDVGLGQRFDIGDHLVLADAYLVRR